MHKGDNIMFLEGYVLSIAMVEGRFNVGSCTTLMDLVNDISIPLENKKAILTNLKEQNITESEPFMLFKYICEYDLSKFCEYVLDGTAKKRLYEFEGYEMASGRLRPEGWDKVV